jgi:hypothetical protein
MNEIAITTVLCCQTEVSRSKFGVVLRHEPGKNNQFKMYQLVHVQVLMEKKYSQSEAFS